MENGGRDETEDSKAAGRTAGMSSFGAGTARFIATESMLVLIFVALSIELFFWDTAGAHFESLPEAERFFYDASGGNHFVGLAVCAWMLFRRRRSFAWELKDENRRPLVLSLAWTLLVVSVCLRMWAAWTSAVEIQIYAIVAWLLGAGGLLGGKSGMRLTLAPCAVLLLSVPLPTTVVNSVLYPMQIMTAEGVAGLLGILNIDHRLYGEQIHVGSFVFYVIEGCAGLRILQTMGLAVCLYLEHLYRDNRQLLFILAAWPVVAIAVNQLRVLMIVLFPGTGIAADHSAQGMIMIALGIITIGFLDAGYERLRPGQTWSPRSASQSQLKPTTRSRPYWVFVAVFVAAVVQLIAGALTPAWIAEEPSTPRAATFTTHVGGFKAFRTLKLDAQFMGSVRGSDHVYRRLRRDQSTPRSPASTEVEILILIDDHRDRRLNIISRKGALLRPGWSIRGQEALNVSGVEATFLELQGPLGHEYVIHWYTGRGSGAEEWIRSVLALEDSPSRRAEPTRSIRVARLGVGDAEEAREELILFAEAVAAELQAVDAGAGQGRRSR